MYRQITQIASVYKGISVRLHEWCRLLASKGESLGDWRSSPLDGLYAREMGFFGRSDPAGGHRRRE